MAIQKEDTLKILSGMMAVMLTTGAAAWWQFGGGVSRAEGEELKKTDSEIHQTVAVMKEQQAETNRALEKIERTVNTNDEKTQTKLDKIIEKLPRP